MSELFQIQHEFTRAFLLSLLHSLWIGAFLYAILRILLTGISHTRSRERYFLATLSVFVFLGMIAGLFLSIYEPLIDGIYINSTQNMLESTGVISNGLIEGQKVIHYSSFSGIIFLLYFAGLTLFTFRLYLSFFKIKKQIRIGQEGDDEIYELLNKLLGKLNIRRAVRVIYSDHFYSPALFGFFKPVIIVPASILTHLSFEQTETILMHELLHLKRYDFLVNLFQHLVEIAFFFNPFIWLISRQIRHERELYCDDRVIYYSKEPATYAKALLNVSLMGVAASPLSLSANGSNRKQLLYRIQRIVKTKAMKTNRKSMLLYSIIIAVGISTIITLSGFSNALFNLEKGKHVTPIVNMNEEDKQESELSLEDELLEMNILASYLGREKNNFALPLLPDTITTEQREEMIASLELALQKLKSIDWEVKLKEIEHLQQEALSQLPEKLKEEQYRIQLELQKIDEDMIRQQMEIAHHQLDSIKEHFDIEELQKEIQEQHMKMEKVLAEQGVSMEELHREMQEALKEFENIDFDQINMDLDSALEDFDFDIQFNFELNLDSIMENVRVEVEAIDIEAIKIDVERSVEELEKQLEELKEKENSENENK